jgi:hypothetical protein
LAGSIATNDIHPGLHTMASKPAKESPATTIVEPKLHQHLATQIEGAVGPVSQAEPGLAQVVRVGTLCHVNNRFEEEDRDFEDNNLGHNKYEADE